MDSIVEDIEWQVKKLIWTLYWGQWEAKVFISRRKAHPGLWFGRWLAKEKMVVISWRDVQINHCVTWNSFSWRWEKTRWILASAKILIHWLIFLHSTGVDWASDSPDLGSAFSVLMHSQSTCPVVPRWHPGRRNRIVVLVFSTRVPVFHGMGPAQS